MNAIDKAYTDILVAINLEDADLVAEMTSIYQSLCDAAYAAAIAKSPFKSSSYDGYQPFMGGTHINGRMSANHTAARSAGRYRI